MNCIAIIVDPNDNKVKIDWFYLKKVVLGTVPYNNISKFSSLAFREEMRISILSQLPRVYHTSPLSTQVLFLTSQCTLLMLRHPRRTFIKFLRLHVPHVLWHDVDPMVKDFCWNSGRNFPICHPFFDISIAQTLHSFHFSTHTLNLCTYSIYSCPYKYQEPVRGEFSSSRKSKNLSIYFSIYFSFLHVLFSQPSYLLFIFLVPSILS